MYLHESIRDAEGREMPMAGVIPGSCWKTDHLQRFGYVTLRAGHPGGPADALDGMRGHEFHYYESTNCGTDMRVVKAGDRREWTAMHVGEDHVWGFPHLYLESCPTFAKHFTEVMRSGTTV